MWRNILLSMMDTWILTSGECVAPLVFYDTNKKFKDLTFLPGFRCHNIGKFLIRFLHS